MCILFNNISIDQYSLHNNPVSFVLFKLTASFFRSQLRKPKPRNSKLSSILIVCAPSQRPLVCNGHILPHNDVQIKTIQETAIIFYERFTVSRCRHVKLQSNTNCLISQLTRISLKRNWSNRRR